MSLEQPTSRQTLGDFEILRELGRGGMGVVYEARQKSLRRHVALKVLAGSLGLTARAVMRFRREAEAAARLHHTNIVPIYFTGEENGVHFYAMELIDGPSLDQVIRHMRRDREFESSREVVSETTKDSSEPLPDWVNETIDYERPQAKTGAANSKNVPGIGRSGSSVASGAKYFDTVATMIADVADALQHAHDHGVISRDIKPSNLLLGSDGRLSVTDFGLARVLEQSGMTMTGEFVGTPRYMSPEQISAGRAPLDHRTDIYSLGATLYELLTLQPPFTGQSRDEVIGQILHKQPLPPRSVNRRVPKDLETICLKAIERDPDRRYQHASGMATDLRAFVNRFAIKAKRVGPVERSVRFLRRNPFATACLGLLCLFSLAAVLAFFLVSRQQREEALAKIEDNILQAVLRGDYEHARDLLEDGQQWRPSDTWIEFSRGLITLFDGAYSPARRSFETVLKNDPEHVGASALLAVAHVWGGDEISYFEQVRVADETMYRKSQPQFRDILFLGYAMNWKSPRRSLDLLEQAEQLRKNHPLVGVLRAQTGRFLAMELTDRRAAKPIIDRALEDCGNAEAYLKDTPLAVAESALTHLAASFIYSRLSSLAKSAELAGEYQQRSSDLRNKAYSKTSHLEALESHSDARYALVHLHLVGRNDKAIFDLSRRWRRAELEVDTFSAQLLALGLFRLREYEEADYWLNRPTGRQAINTGFLKYYLRLADPKRTESKDELLNDVRDYVKRKVETGERMFVTFDSLLLMLLGDEEAMVRLYPTDQLDPMIGDGKIYEAHVRYFSRDPEGGIHTPADLLEACADSSSPAAAFSNAHFELGIEAMSRREWDAARDYFQRCLDDDYFVLYVHLLSAAMLEHEKEWPRWLEDEASTQ